MHHRKEVYGDLDPGRCPDLGTECLRKKSGGRKVKRSARDIKRDPARGTKIRRHRAWEKSPTPGHATREIGQGYTALYVGIWW